MHILRRRKLKFNDNLFDDSVGRDKSLADWLRGRNSSLVSFSKGGPTAGVGVVVKSGDVNSATGIQLNVEPETGVSFKLK